jgi:hypothetical protein
MNHGEKSPKARKANAKLDGNIGRSTVAKQPQMPIVIAHSMVPKALHLFFQV